MEEVRQIGPQAELVAKYEEQIRRLENYMESLENEVANLRRKLNSAHSEEIELRLYETTRELINAHRRNRKLTDALRDVREQIETLKERVDKLTAPPNNYAVFLSANDDGTVDVDLGGRKWRVNVDPSIDVTKLRKGQEVIVNSEYNVVGVRQFDGQGEVVKVKERLDEKRVIVNYRADEERVVELAETVKEEEFRYGDTVLVNLQTGLVMEKLPKAEVKDLLLEEVPDITYDDIGGLDKQIEQIRDAIELPYVYPEEYKEFGLTPPKGILLYGPPGCGKTLIAKAVANSLAKKAREITGNQDIKGYFINIKGPELLNKYVGETERKIREIFQRAKEKAQEGMPVVIFFDEMDSLFRMRGLGISSDMESTIVPQFLAEIDGVEGVRNVIVIGASNRQDLLDPAILRPGRLDIKIKIDRPDEEGARDIFSKYLKPDLPIAQSEIDAAGGDINAAIKSMIERAVEIMYAETDENKFLEVTYAHGEREVLYFRDFVSGAMIANIVSRAKKHALKRYIQGEEEKGIRFEDIEKAIREEFKENEDLPNTANPDDWAKISGRKSERIVSVRTLFDKEERKKDYRIVGTGQYL